MKIVTAFLMSLVAAPVLLVAQDKQKAVSLGGSTPPRSGTVLRERLMIDVQRGTTKVEAKSGNTEMSTRWLHRYTLVRRIQGGGSEDVEVREHACLTGNFTGNMAPPDTETSGPLSSKKLRARRRTNGWEYQLKDGKATAPELNCLLDLGFAAGILEIIPAAIGTQPHKVGEDWKADISSPRGKAYGIPVLKDVNTALGSIEKRDDGDYAHLFVSGSFTLQRPMGYNAVLDVSFAATVVRRLSDALDVETSITGTMKNDYSGLWRSDENAKDEAAMFHQVMPYKLTRTQSVEGK